MTVPNTTLHLLPRTPGIGTALADCIRTCSAGDSILFLEDGVYAVALPDNGLSAFSDSIGLFALQADCAARGLAVQIDQRVRSVGYEDFVGLVARHQRCVTWT